MGSRYATRSMQKAQTTLGPAKKNIEVAEQAIDEYLKQYKKTSDFIPVKGAGMENESGFDKRVQDVTSILEDNGHGIYIIGDLAHGKRITTNTRLKVCVYKSGKIVVQGNPEKKDEVVELLQKTYQDMAVRG